MAEFKKHVLDGSDEEAYQRIKQYLEDREREKKEAKLKTSTDSNSAEVQ